MDLSLFWDQLTTDIWKNEFFQGGFAISIIGAIWLYVRKIPAVIIRLFKRYFTVSLTINKGETLFGPLLTKLVQIHGDSSFGPFINAPVSGGICQLPAGMRWHRQGFSFFRTNIGQRELENALSHDAVTYFIQISVYGAFRRSALDKLLETALKESHKESEKSVRQWDREYWEHIATLPPRSASATITKHTDDIMADLIKFRESREWYQDHGIPYRRGIALYGPPGTGKTSLALAIANELNMDMCMINMSNIGSNGLRAAFAVRDSLIVIEDIDVMPVMHKRKKKSSGKENAGDRKNFFNLADLLNAVDGATSGTGNILIVTSNHLEVIDPALLRPGRIDRVFEIGYLDQDTFDRLCLLYYGKTCGYKVDRNLSAAEVQGVFIRNRDSILDFERELHGQVDCESDPGTGREYLPISKVG